MKKITVFVILSIAFVIFLSSNVNADQQRCITDPEKPRMEIMKGQTKDAKFDLINQYNTTIDGVLVTNQFDCAHTCPRIEILSRESFFISPNGSFTIEYRIISKIWNDAQKLTFSIDVILWEFDNFTIDIIVIVKYNYIMISFCIGVPLFLLIALVVLIHFKKKKKRFT